MSCLQETQIDLDRWDTEPKANLGCMDKSIFVSNPYYLDTGKWKVPIQTGEIHPGEKKGEKQAKSKDLQVFVGSTPQLSTPCKTVVEQMRKTRKFVHFGILVKLLIFDSFIAENC